MITVINSRPWTHQLNFNSSQNGDITGWATGTALSAARRGQGVLVTNSRVYLIGGFTGANPITTIYTATIDGSGVIGSFSTSGVSLPATRANVGIALTKDRVYVIGGISNSSDAESNVVYTATIASDGTLGSFTQTNSLYDSLSQVSTFVYNNYIYAVGRFDINAAPINSDGTLGSWVNKGSLDFSRTGRTVWWTGTRLYVWGGSDDETCRYSEPNVNGEFVSWTSSTLTAGFAYYSNCITVDDEVYLFGGADGSNISNDEVYSAPIVNGVVGSWTTRASTGLNAHAAAILVTSSRVYILGGRTDSTDITTVRYATFSGGFNNYLDKSYEATNDGFIIPPKETIVALGAPGKYASISIVPAKETIVASGSASDTRVTYSVAEFEKWEMEATSGASLEDSFEMFDGYLTGAITIHGDVSGSFELFQCDSTSGAALESNFEEWTADGTARIDIRADIEGSFELFEMTGDISWSVNAQVDAAFAKFTCDGEISKKDANSMSGAFELFTCSGEIYKTNVCSIDASFVPFSGTGYASSSIPSNLEATFENFTCFGDINKSTIFESIKYVR